MSFSLCPWCGCPLEGHPGSPCTARGCVNSRENRDREAPRFVAPVTGQVTRETARTTDEERARKARRRAIRQARRRNRR